MYIKLKLKHRLFLLFFCQQLAKNASQHYLYSCLFIFLFLFQSVSSGKCSPWQHAVRFENQCKNRYNNINACTFICHSTFLSSYQCLKDFFPNRQKCAKSSVKECIFDYNQHCILNADSLPELLFSVFAGWIICINNVMSCFYTRVNVCNNFLQFFANTPSDLKMT